jgi:hypothetical protein
MELDLVTRCVGTAFPNTLLKEDAEEDISRYWINTRKQEDPEH